MPPDTRILSFAGRSSVPFALLLLSATGLAAQNGEPAATARHVAAASTGDAPAEVTFSRDVAPILQRACVRCPGTTASRRCRSSRTKTSSPTRA